MKQRELTKLFKDEHDLQSFKCLLKTTVRDFVVFPSVSQPSLWAAASALQHDHHEKSM